MKVPQNMTDRRQAMRLISQFISGENDHESGNPIDDRALGLLMAIVVIATLAFGIIVHGKSI